MWNLKKAFRAALERNHVTTWDISIVAGSVAVAFGVLVTYFVTFGGGKLGSTETFGHFGDYVGGTLNPVIALAAALLLVLTLRETRKAAKDARNENDEQKLIEYNTRRLELALPAWERTLDSKLTFKLNYKSNGEAQHIRDKSFRDILESPEIQHVFLEVSKGPKYDEVRAHWAHAFSDVRNLLNEIADYCDAMDKLDSAKTVSNFYRRRVNRAQRFLKSVFQLSEDVAQRLHMPIDLGNVGQVIGAGAAYGAKISRREDEA